MVSRARAAAPQQLPAPRREEGGYALQLGPLWLSDTSAVLRGEVRCLLSRDHCAARVLRTGRRRGAAGRVVVWSTGPTRSSSSAVACDRRLPRQSTPSPPRCRAHFARRRDDIAPQSTRRRRGARRNWKRSECGGRCLTSAELPNPARATRGPMIRFDLPRWHSRSLGWRACRTNDDSHRGRRTPAPPLSIPRVLTIRDCPHRSLPPPAVRLARDTQCARPTGRLILYEFDSSPFCRKARVLLAVHTTYACTSRVSYHVCVYRSRFMLRLRALLADPATTYVS